MNSMDSSSSRTCRRRRQSVYIIGFWLTIADLKIPFFFFARWGQLKRGKFIRRQPVAGCAPRTTPSMVTPFGTFQMSKAEFYKDFPKISASASYRLGKVHPRATPMREILPHRVADPKP